MDYFQGGWGEKVKLQWSYNGSDAADISPDHFSCANLVQAANTAPNNNPTTMLAIVVLVNTDAGSPSMVYWTVIFTGVLLSKAVTVNGCDLIVTVPGVLMLLMTVPYGKINEMTD